MKKNTWMKVFFNVESNRNDEGLIFLVCGSVTNRILRTQYNDIESKNPRMKLQSDCLNLPIVQLLY